MKRIVCLLFMECLCGIMFAQQALWGVISEKSPEVLPDNRVTFRMRADKAKSVYITGDFLSSKVIDTPFGRLTTPGMERMTKEKDGVWIFTTSEPLKSELYSYSFIVDSLKVTDPSNIYFARDLNTINNIFIINGDKGNLYRVNDVPHGTVSHPWYKSAEQALLIVPYGRNGITSMV